MHSPETVINIMEKYITMDISVAMLPSVGITTCFLFQNVLDLK